MLLQVVKKNSHTFTRAYPMKKNIYISIPQKHIQLKVISYMKSNKKTLLKKWNLQNSHYKTSPRSFWKLNGPDNFHISFILFYNANFFGLPFWTYTDSVSAIYGPKFRNCMDVYSEILSMENKMSYFALPRLALLKVTLL